MLVALLEPLWKPTHSLQSCDSFDIWSHQSPLSLDHAQTKINVWAQACSQGLVSFSHVTYGQHMCPTATYNHLWLGTADKMHARGVTDTTSRDGTETHFLLVFFAFDLFFLAWSARTVRKTRPIIKLLSGSRLLSEWHYKKREKKQERERMTQSEGKDTTASPYSWETRSLCCVLQYIICSINI